MSFGYTYPSSSQLLMTGQHPVNSCCDSLSPDSQSPVYDSRLLSTYPRLAAVNGFYGASYTDQSGYVALGTNPAAFYSTLSSPYDLKDSRGTWGTLPQAAACYPYDPSLAAAYGDRYGAIDNAARRKNATRETTNTLKAWLYEHRKNPYPTKGEKIMLAIITKMTLTQVSTWFANARRRLKKENKMTWEPRNKTGDAAEDSADDDTSDVEKKEVKQEKLEDSRLHEEDKCFNSRKSPDASSSPSSSIQSPLSERPKIWSLAHTATSSSPPTLRTNLKTSDRYPWTVNGSPVSSESGESLVLSSPLRPSLLPASTSPCYRDPPALIRMTDNGLISDRKSSQSLTPSSGGPTAFKPLSRSSL